MRSAKYGKGQKRPGVMNGTETKYAFFLQRRKDSGEITDFKYEAHKLRLADKTFYTPDFAVLKPDGFIEFHEVKGARIIFHEAAKVKIKVAAEQHWFKFFVVFPERNDWVIEEI